MSDVRQTGLPVVNKGGPSTGRYIFPVDFEFNLVLWHDATLSGIGASCSKMVLIASN